MPDESQAPEDAARSVLRNRAWREVGLAWVLASKTALLGSNTLLLLILARLMPVGSYGVFVTLIGAQVLLSRLLLLGVDGGLIRFRTLDDLHLRSAQVFRSGLTVIFRMWLLLLAVSALVAGTAPRITAARGGVGAVLSVAVGSLGAALVDYCYAKRLSDLHYRGAALIQGGTALARAVLTFAAFAWMPSQPLVVFFVYAGVSCASGFTQVLLIAGRCWDPDGLLTRRLLCYSGWQAAANVTAILNLHQGTFELMFLRGKAAAGSFALGLTLSLGFFVVYGAFYEYALPHAVRIESRSELVAFSMRFSRSALLVVAACLALVCAIGKLAPLFLPSARGAGITTFYFLSASMLLAVLQAPLEAVSQHLLQPQFIFAGWSARVLSSAAIAIGFIFRAQTASEAAVSVAAAQFAGSIVALMLLATLVAYSLRGPREQRGIICAG